MFESNLDNLDIHLDPLRHFMGVYKQDSMSMAKNQFYYGGRSSLKTSRHVTRIVIECILTPKLWNYAIALESTKLSTGLLAEFEKVIERVTDGRFKPGKDYDIIKKPAEVRFSNGSKVFFEGSTSETAIKGRTLPSSSHRWGFVLFDEFSDYKDGRELYNKVKPTFIRDDYKGPFNHPIWKESDLDLDKPALDDEGNQIYDINQYGERVPRLINGKHNAGVKFLFAMNPPKNKFHWVFDFIDYLEKRPDSLVRKVNYDDIYNELIYLGLYSIITEAQAEREADFISYQHTWLGIPVGTEGLFFPTYDPHKARVNTLPPIQSSHWGIGVDIGYAQNATAFVLMGVSGESRYIPRFYYHVNGSTDEKGSMAFANDLINFVLKAQKDYPSIPKRVPVFYDPSAKGFAADVKQLQRERGVDCIMMYKAVNDRQKTLSHVHDLIVSNNLHHTPSQHHEMFEREFQMAETHPKGDDIVKVDDHFIDATRYVSWKLKRYANRDRRGR